MTHQVRDSSANCHQQQLAELSPEGSKRDFLGQTAPEPLCDLRPAREAIAQLAQMWAEMERFVLTMLDSWSTLIHRLALQSEQVVLSGKWTEELTTHLKSVELRLAELAASVSALEAEASGRNPPNEQPPPGGFSGRSTSAAELPPLIVPIRPAAEPTGFTPPPEGRAPTGRNAAENPSSPPDQPVREDRMAALMRQWHELAQKLDELLGEPPIP